ncbi:DUF7018 domain-containing (lipo)protein [Neobacillus sp. NPDC093182]|uniref:DUF7018 domain-containing (lipo)protein n=1 Tax=Neobacillus sp. NPDC093182 TaxID=3364297 RepID=UPI0037FD22C8
MEQKKIQRIGKKIAGQIQTIQDVVNGYKAIKAPAEYKDIHTMYLEAAKVYDEGLSYNRKGLAEQDNDKRGRKPIHILQMPAQCGLKRFPNSPR